MEGGENYSIVGILNELFAKFMTNFWDGGR